MLFELFEKAPEIVKVPDPTPNPDAVVIKVKATGLCRSDWHGWMGHDPDIRLPHVPGHEFAGVVTALGYGTTGFTIGQRVTGLTDWHRNGTLAEFVTVESRNLSPLPDDVEFVDGAALVMSGLTAWQGLFTHGNLKSGQRVMILGAAGIVGSMAVQLAKNAGAYVIGTGRANGKQAAMEFGANEYIDLEGNDISQIEAVDLVFDVIGGTVVEQSAKAIKPGGILVTITGPTEVVPENGTTVDFVVEAVPAQLNEVIAMFRNGKLKTNISKVVSLDDAIKAINGPRQRGKIVIQVND